MPGAVRGQRGRLRGGPGEVPRVSKEENLRSEVVAMWGRGGRRWRRRVRERGGKRGGGGRPLRAVRGGAGLKPLGAG